MADRDLVVRQHGNGSWAVERVGEDEPISTHPSREAASDAAHQIARGDHASITVHSEDGAVVEQVSYRDGGAG